ncbi:MAG: M20 metallopeptidase family protein [Candidatus Limnocylindrales bacterium]
MTARPSLLSDAQAILPDIVALRRTLHRHPEVGLQLPWTQSVVVAELERLGLKPRLGTSVSSVTAVIEGARPGPTILLRADMDGLPLHEDTGLAFASETGDTMHACGHDTHMSMLLGAARLLLDRRDQLTGNVLLMFQPGEEGWHGARYMLDEGLLEAASSPVQAAFAIHIGTHWPTGTIHLRPGAIYAAADTIHLTVRGRGGHASTPHLSLDPIPVAAEIILALQSMVTRTVDVFDPTVLTIGHVVAGTRDNITPETALIEGTIRSVSEATRATVHEGVRRVVRGVCEAHGATAELEIEPGYGVTVNDPAFTGMVREVAAEVVGAHAVHVLEAPLMGAEDFSYVLQRVPGAMVQLGARPADVDEATAPQVHSNRVVFDEPSLAVGAALHAAVALRYLGGA